MYQYSGSVSEGRGEGGGGRLSNWRKGLQRRVQAGFLFLANLIFFGWSILWFESPLSGEEYWQAVLLWKRWRKTHALEPHCSKKPTFLEAKMSAFPSMWTSPLREGWLWLWGTSSSSIECRRLPPWIYSPSWRVSAHSLVSILPLGSKISFFYHCSALLYLLSPVRRPQSLIGSPEVFAQDFSSNQRLVEQLSSR